jgi:hypothetical protein
MMFLFYDSFECKFMFTRNVLHIRKKKEKNLWLWAQILLLNIVALLESLRHFVIMWTNERTEKKYHISLDWLTPSMCHPMSSEKTFFSRGGKIKAAIIHFKHILLSIFQHSSLTCDDKILICFIRTEKTVCDFITQFLYVKKQEGIFYRSSCVLTFPQRFLWMFYLSLKTSSYSIRRKWDEYLWNLYTVVTMLSKDVCVEIEFFSIILLFL